MAKKDFAAMDARGASGATAARAALRSRFGHPSSVRLEELQPNPHNPRYADDDPEVVELAATLRTVGQLQPALVVTREQFVRAYPDATLGDQPWVVLVGNRRLAAARLAGRAALDVRVEAELDTVEELEDRVLIENIQRKDLPPLLEAQHLQRRLARPGQTIRSVGEAIGKSHTYVQQRIDLLGMIPELQRLFRSGVINIKTGRALGALPVEDQQRVLAGGPPYALPARSAPIGNGSGADRPAAAPSATAPPPTNGATTDENPVSTPAPPATIPTAPDVPVRPLPAAAEASSPAADGWESRRAAVARWLDAAMAELTEMPEDPVGSDDGIDQTLQDVRRLMREARALLG